MIALAKPGGCDPRAWSDECRVYQHENCTRRRPLEGCKAGGGGPRQGQAAAEFAACAVWQGRCNPPRAERIRDRRLAFLNKAGVSLNTLQKTSRDPAARRGENRPAASAHK